MNEFLQKAKQMKSELVRMRRYLHENAEIGFALKKTTSFVKKELESLGFKPENCGKSGIVATVGAGKKTFLLRADMDALPIRERSGLPFACKNGNMHACGHDLHTAALIGAAKLLKEEENSLKGRVKLVFQPAEEILEGAEDVIKAGVLEGVNGGMTVHVTTGLDMPVGTAVVASEGVSAPAADYFRIETVGKGCHGAAPWNGVDALTVSARILLALQELAARELPIADPVVLTVGTLKTQGAGNVISDRASLEGTVRSFDEEWRSYVKRRIAEIAKNVAKAFRAKAKVVYEGGCPTLVNDGELSSFALRTVKEVLGENAVFASDRIGGNVRSNSGGSEDFAYFSHVIPTVMVAVSAGERKNGYTLPLHHPQVKFDENALPITTAIYASIAKKWLENNA